MALNIVKPYAKIIDLDIEEGINLLKKIEWCGRISHRSEEAQTDESWKRFIQAVVMQHGDWSIVEHASVTVDFLVDRGITHELVRHRIASYTQESTRFVNYEKKIPAAFIEPEFKTNEARQAWVNGITTAEDYYKHLLKLGEAPQIARSVFPNSLASRLIVTANLRSWRQMLMMRTTKESHPQMREIMIPLLAEFQQKIPIIFDDIVPFDRQADGMRKGR